MTPHITSTHQLRDDAYITRCKAQLDAHGALVLGDFFSPQMIEDVVAQAESQQD